jgi:hypothetical protein
VLECLIAKGSKDLIAPPGFCVAGETRRQIKYGNVGFTSNNLNRTIEKYVSHVFIFGSELQNEFVPLVFAVSSLSVMAFSFPYTWMMLTLLSFLSINKRVEG